MKSPLVTCRKSSMSLNGDNSQPSNPLPVVPVDPLKQYEKVVDKQYGLIQQLNEHNERRKEDEKDKEVQ